MAIQVVVLAAGQGKRMVSTQPKVLHAIAGKSMLQHVLETASRLSPQVSPIIVYGHQGALIQQAFSHQTLQWAEQKEQLGTGHAVLQAMPHVKDQDRVLVLYGDVPLISEETLKNLVNTTPNNALGMLTATLTNPKGYGRIKRDDQGHVIGIVEEKDATEAERTIQEINPGIYLVPAKWLKKWLPTLNNHNAQKEYYLTDIIKLAVAENIAVHTVKPEEVEEIMGVNDRLQLSTLERFYHKKAAERLLRQGVTLYDPARFDLRGELQVGKNVVIDVNVIIEGRVIIGDDCYIGPNVILRNTVLANQVEVKANSLLDGAEVGEGCILGPFARLRPGTILKRNVRIGNFVELKNTIVDIKSKINHLSYVGDSEIGSEVNIGAGTITCNYDGVNKHKTIIGDHAFIGSCTQLVAPVVVGEGAIIGAGSTITRDAPAHKLTLSRVPQVTLNEWTRPEKLKKS